MFYTIVSGRNGQNLVSTQYAHTMREVLKAKFKCVKTGDDWVEVHKHSSLYGGRVSYSMEVKS